MRFVKFRNSFANLIDTCRPDLVAYEEVRRHMGTDAAHIYGGIISHIQTICLERGINYTAIPVATVKRVATGKGNADKDAMLAAARARWGNHITNDNEADALWILEAARQEVA
jgi:Holliday junction resolvasome RuvABC endonuclease subunit